MVLVGPELAGPAETGLDLVDDEEGAVLAAELGRCGPVLLRGQVHALSLDDLEDNGRDVGADLARLGPHAALDFSGYVLDKVHVHQCDYNWKTFIEVYLEDYHVTPFHPGLGQFVACEDLRWEFGADYSVQTVGPKNELAKPG